MRCEYGFCIVCDKEIASKCSGCDTRKPNGQYTEVMLSWSNGSRMSMAVCLDCAPHKIWKTDKKVLTQAVWDAWDKKGHTYDKEIILVD